MVEARSVADLVWEVEAVSQGRGVVEVGHGVRGVRGRVEPGPSPRAALAAESSLHGRGGVSERVVVDAGVVLFLELFVGGKVFARNLLRPRGGV